ncbi:hypothetical protein BKA62DRAFT_692729 [Auriculariales sp. MPI-PUGE-AT-0066]|nr:hypothetical protein BKA62DRAFT_692729 [Auriculariales sp. MPI-PUGE-AT-0066]
MLSRPQTGWYPSSQTEIRTAGPRPTRPTNANAAQSPSPCSCVVAAPASPARCADSVPITGRVLPLPRPLSIAAWSEFCPPETITLNSFPFSNASVDIPLWALGNTTNTGSSDLAQAKRIAGVKEPFPTTWIIVISLAIAAIFFLLFLAVFCYIRRHRVQTWMQRRRGGGGGGRNSATYAQIERKSFDAAGNPKPKKDRRKVKQRGGHGLDLDSESGSGRSVYQAPTNASGYFAVSGYEDPFGARVPAPPPAPIPIAHQRHASASSINLLPDHPNAGYEVATVSSGKGNHPSKAYASGSGGGGGGGGGAPGKYSDRARAQAADNAMKRSDRRV